MWKGQGIKREGNRVVLPNKQGQKRLKIKLPVNFPAGKIVAADLGFRESRLTVRQSLPDVASAGDNVVAADLGVIHLAAMTDGIESKVIVGRGLRSLAQYKNKQLAAYDPLLSKCTTGSSRSRKPRESKARMLSRYEKQKHNLPHHAASQMIEHCVDREAGTLVLGDCFKIAHKAKQKKKGSKRSNQMNSANPLGQLETYLIYKGKKRGVKIKRQEESFTTQSCPKCGHRHKPSGRMYVCKNPDCDFVGIRDLVGAANIKSKHENNGKLVPNSVIPTAQAKYLRPVKTPVIRSNVVVRLADGKSLGITLDSVSPAAAADGKTSTKLNLVA